jgi:hypothetical protein
MTEEHRNLARKYMHKLCDGCIRDRCFCDLYLSPYEYPSFVCDFPSEFEEQLEDYIPEYDTKKHYQVKGVWKCRERKEDWKLWNKYVMEVKE